jgi:hypothetical protein
MMTHVLLKATQIQSKARSRDGQTIEMSTTSLTNTKTSEPIGDERLLSSTRSIYAHQVLSNNITVTQVTMNLARRVPATKMIPQTTNYISLCICCNGNYKKWVVIYNNIHCISFLHSHILPNPLKQSYSPITTDLISPERKSLASTKQAKEGSHHHGIEQTHKHTWVVMRYHPKSPISGAVATSRYRAQPTNQHRRRHNPYKGEKGGAEVMASSSHHHPHQLHCDRLWSKKRRGLRWRAKVENLQMARW